MAKARGRRAGKKRKVSKKAKPKKVKKTLRKKATRKKTAKRPAKKTTARAKKPAAAKRPARQPVKGPVVPPGEQPIGMVIHYYSHLGVAVVKLNKGALQVGDVIHIKGHTSDFRQVVESMQVEHQAVTKAMPGDDFGLKVSNHAREHDVVYRVLNP